MQSEVQVARRRRGKMGRRERRGVQGEGPTASGPPGARAERT